MRPPVEFGDARMCFAAQEVADFRPRAGGQGEHAVQRVVGTRLFHTPRAAFQREPPGPRHAFQQCGLAHPVAAGDHRDWAPKGKPELGHVRDGRGFHSPRRCGLGVDVNALNEHHGPTR